MNTCAFTTTNCGAHDGTATAAAGTNGLTPNSQVELNGSLDLSSCVVGPKGAQVDSIQLVPSANPIYAYQIQVVGRAPSGLGSGSLYLSFTDQTGDTYKLWIWRGKTEQHTVDYNSAKPNIVSFRWSDSDK